MLFVKILLIILANFLLAMLVGFVLWKLDNEEIEEQVEGVEE